MLFSSVTRWLKPSRQTARPRPSRPRRRVKPRLEALEDRWVPSTDLVTNLSGSAAVSDSLPYWVANAGNGDTIQFAANLKGGTITLGDTLDINKYLTIDGAGSGITVNGGGNRVFVIEQGFTAGINALTITGGVAPPILNGGGLFNTRSLWLSDSRATGNSGESNGRLHAADPG